MEAVIESPENFVGTDAPVPAETAGDVGGKYLTFLLGNEEYGVDILKVRELIGITDITKVPQTSDFVEGVIDLRGRVIPVIDLRTKFGLERTAYNEQTCIIIVVDVGTLMGIVVDTVREVHDIHSNDVEPVPILGTAVDTSFILGMGKVKGEVKILLNIDEVLTSEELVASDEMSAV